MVVDDVSEAEAAALQEAAEATDAGEEDAEWAQRRPGEGGAASGSASGSAAGSASKVKFTRFTQNLEVYPAV